MAIEGTGAIILGIIFLLLGIFLTIFFVHGYIKGKQALSWPSISGVIVNSKIDGGDDGPPVPDVIYEYQIGDEKYIGRNLSFTKVYTNANKIVKQYKKGKVVELYYNPAKPEDSVLEIEPVVKLKGQIIVATIFSYLAAIYFIFTGV